MLSNDLALVSNRSSVTLPGSDASTSYVLIPPSSLGTVSRRVAGTAFTKPKELHITQQITKSGQATERARTVVKAFYSEKDTPVTTAAGTVVVPSMSCTVTIDRPSAAEIAGAISDTEVKTMVGAAFDAVIQNIAALLSGEA
jgi:hypothetical protein